MAVGVAIRFASVMEAADDLCYHLLDLEDGLRLQLIDDRRSRYSRAVVG